MSDKYHNAVNAEDIEDCLEKNKLMLCADCGDECHQNNVFGICGDCLSHRLDALFHDNHIKDSTLMICEDCGDECPQNDAFGSCTSCLGQRLFKEIDGEEQDNG